MLNTNLNTSLYDWCQTVKADLMYKHRTLLTPSEQEAERAFYGGESAQAFAHRFAAKHSFVRIGETQPHWVDQAMAHAEANWKEEFKSENSWLVAQAMLQQTLAWLFEHVDSTPTQAKAEEQKRLDK